MTDEQTRHLIRKRITPDFVVDVMNPVRSKEFQQLCLNRLRIGALRYGVLGEEGKPQFDRISDMIRRLQAFQRDHNLEHLVDVANLCECEFVEGKFHGLEVVAVDDGEHTKEKT